MRSRLDANIKADLEAAQKTGYEQGYRDGLAALEGFKKAHAEQMNAQLAQWMRGLDGEFDALHEGLAAGVARVAVQLARQVLRSELRTAPELVSRVAAEAMEAVLHSARHITLHAHPDDLPLVAAGAQEALRARGARLVADADIARGGCRIESDVGGIDARIDSRWARAAAGLIGDIGDDAGGAVSGDLGWHEAPHGRDPQGAA
jgi:flagellar assembly protein FliH